MYMAMSDTGSSFAHWAGLYHHEPSLLEPPTAAAAASAASPTKSAGSGGSPTKSAAQQQLGVEGPRAAGKPAARRRTRASRRAPVTLLNTDTANFRAMVQQFTGIPAPPPGAFASGHAGAAPVINFAAEYGFPPPAGLMSFDHFHHHNAPAPLQDQLIRRQQQQQYAGATFGYGNGNLQGTGASDLFASAEDRMLLQSMQAAQIPHSMLPASTAANHSSASGYFA